MTEEQFWKLIGSMPDIEEKYIGLYQYFQRQRIEAYLLEHGKPAILAFQKLLLTKIKTLCLPKIGELYYLTAYDVKDATNRRLQYISVDGFIDFRAWILSLGKQAYETFLHFESEEELLGFNMSEEYANREDLVYIAEQVSLSLKEVIVFDFHIEQANENDVCDAMDWNHLDKKYPVLFKKYQKH